MRLAELEFDLDVFSGPFDLLLTLILREEVDLREVSLAEIVISYIDHLEARGELDLEATTEFIVLVAALLELKSRLLLPGEELDELIELARARRSRSCSRGYSRRGAIARRPRSSRGAWPARRKSATARPRCHPSCDASTSRTRRSAFGIRRASAARSAACSRIRRGLTSATSSSRA